MIDRRDTFKRARQAAPSIILIDEVTTCDDPFPQSVLGLSLNDFNGYAVICHALTQQLYRKI
jgi:ABC-type transporter Mla maintaining outer membrane lipid asymmetry ATPase subunit MlaF